MDKAIAAGQQGLGNMREILSSTDTSTATLLLRLAKKYRAGEEFDLAEKCYDGCVKIRRRILGHDHLDVANALNGLGVLTWQLGRYDEAEALHQEALSIRERQLGNDHIDVSESLTNLGLVYLDLRRYKEGQDVLMRALVIEKKVNGSQSLSAAQSELNLGNAFYVQADYNHAEEHYLRGLETRERLLGKNHRDVAALYDNLGNCYYDQGRFSEAEALYLKALRILEDTASGGKRDLAICFQNLGILYTETGQYDLAEKYLVQALDLRRNVFASDNAEVAVSYANLADFMALRKQYAVAESLYLRALPVCSEHERLAMTSALADLYTDVGSYAAAESLYKQLDRSWQRSSTTSHPQLADFLGSYSLFFRHQHNATKAESYAWSALQMWKNLFSIGASVMSERDALIYSMYTGTSLSDYLSSTLLSNGRFMQIERVHDAVLSSKGAVSDLVFERRKKLAETGDSLTTGLERKLRNTQLTLVRLYNGEEEIEGQQRQRRKMDSLNSVCNKLEAQIARRSAVFRKKKDYQNVSAKRISSLLPLGATLLEYLKWEYMDFRLDKVVPHYLVVVVPRTGKPLVKDLGEADRIDRAVQRYRKHLVDLSERLAKSGEPLTNQDQMAYTSTASELYGLLWQPVESHIKQSGPVFIAPDAGLNLISFAGLLDKKGNYLIEKVPIHYLTAGRDLIRLKDRDVSGSGLLAFGDPDYDAPVDKRASGSNAVRLDASKGSSASRIRSACGSLNEIKVGRLFNTRQEVEAIAGYWKQDYASEPAVVYTDARASEENFKSNAQGKRAIHLATHGYVLQNECLPKQQAKGPGHAPTRIGENPLVLCGIFLAGSNLHGTGTEEHQSDDGVVTALEVSSMDLRGVDLVTLSACETALGEVQQGEGVYGLRRAFQISGARTVVSALWRVPDNETKALMKAFYAQLGTSYPELMQKAAVRHINDLRLIGRPTHPYSWGGFIATGDWRRQ